MPPRGKSRGGFNKRKGFKKSSSKPQGKKRKTYSLHALQNKPESNKRQHRDDNTDVLEKKRKKEDVVSSEDSESEVEEHMDSLLATFGNIQSKSMAIDSSSDSEEEVDNEINSIENEDNSDEDEANSDKDEANLDKDEANSDKDEDIKEEIDGNDDEAEEEIEVETGNVPDLNEEDPFEKHFLHEMNESLVNVVTATPVASNIFKETWSEIGKITLQIPKCESTKAISSGFSLIEEKKFAPGGVVPQIINLGKNNMSDLFIKTQIVDNISKANKALRDKTKIPLTPLQGELFTIFNNYQDLYYPYRTFDNAEEIRFTYCLHAVNHILKTRTKVLHHNARLSKKDDVPEEFRDQGLVRPKILIILPFRDAAYKVINFLIEILIKEDKGNVSNKKRFLDEFTGNDIIMPKKNPKPEDYELLFSGNSNDDFKIGLTFTKKTLKLYADFYSSDIIIASPIGLRYIIGAEGEAERDYDFLTSIELLIIDQTEVFLMQNWDHLLHIINHLHLQPKASHGTDFSRVRTWSLNGWAKFYRQTLIFSSAMLPEINSIFNKKCHNYAGKVKVANPVQFGTISQAYVQLPHVFHKFSSQTAQEAIDCRFNYFLNSILPEQKDTLMKQTLIFVANYFDYVRLRNYFKKEDIGFVQICEYSKESKIARARDMFFHGDAHFMLYTERFHFFNRKRIKGIRHLIFYQLPNISHFYYEICNLMQEANMNKKIGNTSNMTVTVLYSKYDIQQLSAVVGTDRALKMVSSEKNVHMLVTG